jgi:hypothetical protein
MSSRHIRINAALSSHGPDETGKSPVEAVSQRALRERGKLVAPQKKRGANLWAGFTASRLARDVTECKGILSGTASGPGDLERPVP